uniref:Uncharacterized protein n=1 Tax=Eutreptiella gymnastica TaxID=73025 RepID=A0A7S1HZA6_9EUGL
MADACSRGPWVLLKQDFGSTRRMHNLLAPSLAKGQHVHSFNSKLLPPLIHDKHAHFFLADSLLPLEFRLFFLSDRHFDHKSLARKTEGGRKTFIQRRQGYPGCPPYK